VTIGLGEAGRSLGNDAIRIALPDARKPKRRNAGPNSYSRSRSAARNRCERNLTDNGGFYSAACWPERRFGPASPAPEMASACSTETPTRQTGFRRSESDASLRYRWRGRLPIPCRSRSRPPSDRMPQAGPVMRKEASMSVTTTDQLVACDGRRPRTRRQGMGNRPAPDTAVTHQTQSAESSLFEVGVSVLAALAHFGGRRRWAKSPLRPTCSRVKIHRYLSVSFAPVFAQQTESGEYELGTGVAPRAFSPSGRAIRIASLRANRPASRGQWSHGISLPFGATPASRLYAVPNGVDAPMISFTDSVPRCHCNAPRPADSIRLPAKKVTANCPARASIIEPLSET